MPQDFTPVRNPDDEALRRVIMASRHKAARRIIDERDGTVWVWPFEQASHAEGAARLAVPYSRPPGSGDVLI